METEKEVDGKILRGRYEKRKALMYIVCLQLFIPDIQHTIDRPLLHTFENKTH